MRVEAPPDYRIVPLLRLRELMPLPGHDEAEREQRRILHREEIAKAVRK